MESLGDDPFGFGFAGVEAFDPAALAGRLDGLEPLPEHVTDHRRHRNSVGGSVHLDGLVQLGIEQHSEWFSASHEGTIA